ncbi:hypothetical protein V8C35DRAFT_299966 [Trichoderma chlorosporum]
MSHHRRHMVLCSLPARLAITAARSPSDAAKGKQKLRNVPLPHAISRRHEPALPPTLPKELAGSPSPDNQIPCPLSYRQTMTMSKCPPGLTNCTALPTIPTNCPMAAPPRFQDASAWAFRPLVASTSTDQNGADRSLVSAPSLLVSFPRVVGNFASLGYIPTTAN